MKLGDFLSQPQAHHVRPRPVAFRLSGMRGSERLKHEEAEASLVFVDDPDRAEAVLQAERELHTEYGNVPIPDEERHVRRAYHILFRALRDPSDGVTKVADSVLALRRLIHPRVAMDLITRFWRFVEEEFPESLGDREFDKLAGEAEKKS